VVLLFTNLRVNIIPKGVFAFQISKGSNILQYTRSYLVRLKKITSILPPLQKNPLCIFWHLYEFNSGKRQSTSYLELGNLTLSVFPDLEGAKTIKKLFKKLTK
jgi:hypothetical protein